MARQPLHTDDIKVEQKSAIIGNDVTAHDGEVVIAQQVDLDKDYADKLKFMEEPVTIRIEPSSQPNAPSAFPIWVNGKGAEILINGRWVEVAYLPVNETLTIKRKYLAVMVTTKIDTVHTRVQEPDGADPTNRIDRITSPVHSFSILSDPNPLGHEWLRELRRRNF